jgi:hypothetical protein
MEKGQRMRTILVGQRLIGGGANDVHQGCRRARLAENIFTIVTPGGRGTAGSLRYSPSAGVVFESHNFISGRQDALEAALGVPFIGPDVGSFTFGG